MVDHPSPSSFAFFLPRARADQTDPMTPPNPDFLDDPSAGGPSRRTVLRQAGRAAFASALAGGLAALPGRALADEAPSLPADGAPFQPGLVADLARALAKRPYAAPRTDDLPDALTGLNREQ